MRKIWHMRRLVPVFRSAQAGAGLEIRPDKCALVPIIGRVADVEERVREALCLAVPEWAGFKVSDHATYLGYVLEPGAGRYRWAKPVAKCEDRAGAKS